MLESAVGELDPWWFCVCPGESAFGQVDVDAFAQTHSCVLIARKSVWERTQHLEDRHLTLDLPNAAQGMLAEVMESVFAYPGSVENAITACCAAGLVFSPAMARVLGDFYV